MLSEHRRQAILEELGRVGSVSVMRLAEQLEVSDMTIRRDLNALTERNLLHKVHGGAVPVRDGSSSEQHFTQKRLLNQPEKQAIARVAVEQIQDGSTVALSSGTTTWHIAAALQRTHRRLGFITNSTNVALVLQENGWDQIVLSGGTFRTPSDALVGPYADATLRSLNADMLFVGVHGIHPEAGLTTPNVAEAETNRRLVDMARTVVIVADHTKLGVTAMAKIAHLSQVDVLITDHRASETALGELEQADVRVMVAESDVAAGGGTG